MSNPFELSLRLSAKQILEMVSEEVIYARFCSDFPKKLCHSPFRTDRNPSFSFFNKNGRWRWKDFATDESGDVFEFVQKIPPATDFVGALDRITSAFMLEQDAEFLNQKYQEFVINAQKRRKQQENSLLQAVLRKPADYDYEYWVGRYGIGKAILEYYNTLYVKEVWYNKDLLWVNNPKNPIYGYYFPASTHLKCYRPLEKTSTRKWVNNCNNETDIQGYHQCQIKKYPGQLLVIQKAQKENMYLRKYGINSMAPHGEGHKSINSDFIRHIKKYCGRIVTMFDNDEAGRKAGIFWEQEFNIEPIVLPENWPYKNITDIHEKESPKLVIDLLKKNKLL